MDAEKKLERGEKKVADAKKKEEKIGEMPFCFFLLIVFCYGKFLTLMCEYVCEIHIESKSAKENKKKAEKQGERWTMQLKMD